MNRNIIIYFGAIVLWLISPGAFSQQDSAQVMKFSLKQARDFALENNAKVVNALKDIESAKSKVWETMAIGLPHVDAKYSYSYMLKLPASFQSIKDALSNTSQSTGDAYLDTLFKHILPLTKGIDWEKMQITNTLDVSVSQLIFNGSYIVGLQTTKVFKGLSELSYVKSKNEVLENVTNSYFIVLIAKENKTLLDTLYKNVLTILDQSEKTVKLGFLDETDVDQIKLTVNSVKNSLDLITRQLELSERLVKFQLGIELNQKIELTDSISGLQLTDLSSMVNSDIAIDDNLDYKLLDTQVKLSKLNLKLKQSEYLPVIAAFYNHEENFNKSSFTFNPPNVVGISVSLPIFSSGQRMAKVKQAKIDFEKSVNIKEQGGQGILLDFAQTKSDYLNALDKCNRERDNMSLSNKIYNRTIVKFKNGNSSSMDLTQAQNQYITNESNYYRALIELISAKSKLERILSSN
jgi:outer membrane protein